MIVTTSVVVNFGTSEEDKSSQLLRAEVDDREEGYNNGKTSFIPGDNVGILLFSSESFTLTQAIASKGTVSKHSDTHKSIDDFFQIEGDREIDLTYPVESTFTKEWYGINLGNITRINEGALQLSNDALEPPYVGVVKIAYSSPCGLWVLSDTLIADKTEYPIIVFFQGEIPD